MGTGKTRYQYLLGKVSTAVYTITDVKDITDYVRYSSTDDYYEVFAVTEVLNGDDEKEEYHRFVIVEHKLEKRVYSIECTLKYGDEVGTWDGDSWDFGVEYHSFKSLDEARDNFERAKRDLENIATISLLYTETFEDCDRVCENSIEYFKNED